VILEVRIIFEMGCACAFEKEGKKGFNDVETVYLKILRQELKERRVVVFTCTGCTKSATAKEILKSEKIDFEYFDLNKVPEGKEFFIELQKITEMQKTPFLFYDKNYIGGLDEIQNLIQKVNNDKQTIRKKTF